MPGDAEGFVSAYESAGIRAPESWAVSTASQVCSAWADGLGTDYTDEILLDGGIYDNHVRDFSDIIERHFCPGHQP